jgi:hypothetical protein
MKAYVMIPMNTTVQSWSLGFNFSTSLESFEVRSLFPIEVKYSLIKKSNFPHTPVKGNFEGIGCKVIYD